jgi:invasion protein IalB
VKVTTKFGILAGLAAVAWSAAGWAQTAPKAKNPPPAVQTAPLQPEAAPSPNGGPPPPGWIARCTSAGRDAPLECAMEATAVLTKTGQLVVLVNIRVTSETRTPVALVQLPLGLNLPAGARFQVDEGKALDLQIQTCENRGCYASSPIAPDLLSALKSGKQLKISFQNLGKETITVPMPLTDFAAAYDKIR